MTHRIGYAVRRECGGYAVVRVSFGGQYEKIKIVAWFAREQDAEAVAFELGQQ